MSFSHEHDMDMDMDNVSVTSDEPSCSSPKASGHQSGSRSSANKNTDILAKLAEMGAQQDDSSAGHNQINRREFIQKLQKIWEDYSIFCRSFPNISKQPLDLYRLYLLVKEKGGFNEVCFFFAFSFFLYFLCLNRAKQFQFYFKVKHKKFDTFVFLSIRRNFGRFEPFLW